jgi:hypothetical protein
MRATLTFAALLVAGVVAGCGTSTPRPAATPRPKPTPTKSPQPTSLTVIAPDGVNFRSAPSTTAPVLQVVAQGVTLPIVSETSAGGGWWEVKGNTATGWVTSNPEDTSTASFQMYQSGGTSGWSVLYSAGWQFAQLPTGVIDFNGPGGESISVTTAGSTAQLPPAAPSGTATSGVSAVVVYGVTTSLVTFAVTNGYLGAVAFQASPGLAFLIVAKGGAATTAADFQLFLDTFKFPLPAGGTTP